MDQVSQTLGNVTTVTGMTLDIIVLAVIFIVLAGYGFYFGKNKIIAFILAYYPASLLFANFSRVEQLTFWRDTASQVTMSRLVIYLVFFIIINIVLVKVIHSGEFSYSRSGRFLGVGLLALAGVVTVLVFNYYTLSLATLYQFTDTISGLFTAGSHFWWLLAPLAGIFIAHRYG